MASCAFGQAVPQVVPPVDNAQRVTLSGNVHPLARAEFDRGAADSGLPMGRILLLLKRSDAQEAALQTYMEQQQDKSSPNYQIWLTPAQFEALYGPADNDVQAVTQWLGSQGFTVNKVHSGKTLVEFSGTVAQVQAAFGTAIHNFQVNGQMYVANATDPQIPAALAPVVTGIVSLNNFPRQSHVRVAGHARKIAGQPGLQPLFTFPIPEQGNTFYGVGPADFATIYNSQSLISSGNNGSGQTIAVVGETDINVADVQAFRQIFGLPANFTTSNVILNGEDPGITSQAEEVEADLDVQWSGAVAPGATIDYVVSESTPASQGIDLSALYIIEYNLAGVMSESYGACESALGTAGNAFYNSLWEQAAAQGITVVLSAGDGGSAGCDNFDTATTAQYGLAVSGMASTPFNVAVGGTDFDDVNTLSTYWNTDNNSTTGESVLSYIPEIPWNQTCAQISLTGCAPPPANWPLNIVAGSGGASTSYSKPNWQIGVAGMPNDSHRDLPDVSLFASPGFDGSGYVICAGDGTTITGPSNCSAATNNFTMTIVGGTSASAPSFAGVMALVNQKQSSTQNPTPRQGNPNPVLYALAKKTGASCMSVAKEAATCIFNDITHGNSALTAGVGTNSVPCQGGTPNCSETVSTENGVLVEPSNSKIEAYTVNAGYDLVTGLGSVNIGNLASNWSTVSTVPTTTTLTLSPSTGITHGTAENVTVNVTVTPTSGTATGDVSLIATIAGPSGATTQGLDQFTLASGKVVNATTNSLPGGTSYQVHAHYAGDGTNAPSDSAPVTVSVGQESSKTFIVVPTYDTNGNLVSGNASTVAYGSLYLLSMYVTDKNATSSTSGPPTPACYQENTLTCPTGTVSLTDGGTLLGTGRGGSGNYYLNSAGHTENLTLNLTGGTHTLVATYSGDNSYQGSTSATTNLTVTPATTQTQIGYIPPNLLLGEQILLEATVTYTVSSNSVAPTGTVTFYDGTTAFTGTAALTPGQNSMLASLTTTCPAAGPQTVTIKYSGDNNYAASTSSPATVPCFYPVLVSQSESSDTINYGQSITVTAVFSSTSKSPAMTGTVQFVSTTATFSNVTTTPGTDSKGNQIITATATATPTFPGSISVSYSGDQYYAAASNGGDFVNVIFPDFSFGSSGVSVVPTAGQAGSAPITISPATQTQAASTVALSVSPVTISGYTVGINPQQVSLNGTSATATLSLTPTTSSPANVVRGKVRHAGFTPFSKANWWLFSLLTGLAAFAVLTGPSRRKRLRLALGLTAVCLFIWILGCGGGGGSNGGGGGGGGAGGGNNGPQATTITLATSNAKVTQSGQFTITATVTGNATHPPTGNVLFSNFGTPFTTYLLTNGQTQIGPAALGNIGVYQITATYQGDTYNEPSTTSSSLAQVVTGTTSVTIQGVTGNIYHTTQATVGVQ